MSSWEGAREEGCESKLLCLGLWGSPPNQRMYEGDLRDGPGERVSCRDGGTPGPHTSPKHTRVCA